MRLGQEGARPQKAYEQEGVAYYKSSKSGPNGCVVAGIQGDTIVVGDTKNPDRKPFGYTLKEWNTFVAAVKRGEFDVVDE